MPNPALLMDEDFRADCLSASRPYERDEVKCAACGAVIAKDDADRRFLTPEDAADDNWVYLCQDCSAGVEVLEEICR